MIMLQAHFFLPVYAKIPMVMQWENIALYPGSKKHSEESSNKFFSKSMLLMVPKKFQIRFKVLLKYKVNSTFQEGLFLKALYGEAGKVTKTCVCPLISEMHPNELWKLIPRIVCDMLRNLHLLFTVVRTVSASFLFEPSVHLPR